MTATLAASLLDRSTKRLSVALAMGERAAVAAPVRAKTSDASTLFFSKGKATAEQFIRAERPAAAHADNDASPFFAKGEASAEQFIPTPADDRIETAPAPVSAPVVAVVQRAPAQRRPRLWLRLAPEQRLQVRRAAAHLGQSAQAFMRDAVDHFLANPTRVATMETPWHSLPWLRWRGVSLAPQRVKLSISVDAERQERMHGVAAEMGQTLQFCLTQAVLQHLNATTPAIARRAAAERALGLVRETRVRASDRARSPVPDSTLTLLRAAS